MNEDTCICCGAVIPEGRQVCWICERSDTMRLIDADEAEKYFYEHLDDLHMAGAMNAINEMPTIDANPVKRGKWVYGKELGLISEKIIYCSFCMREAYYSEYGAEKFPFCPYCGAEMYEN